MFRIIKLNFMTKLECTAKVARMRLADTDDEVCRLIGISKPTLYLRLKIHNWKSLEIFKLERI